MAPEITQSNKLEKFKNAVFAEIDVKIHEIEDETAQLKQQELEKNKDNQLNKMFDLIQDAIKQIKKECRKDVSKYDLNSRREVLLKRSEITARVFENASNRLSDFCASEKYYDYFKNSLSTLLNSNKIEDVDILLSERDITLADKIKADFPQCKNIAQSNEIVIGGFIAKCDKTNIYFDETLDDKLDQQKQYFINNSHLYI